MAAHEDLERTSLGKYKVVNVLAHGGMGVVYEGFDPSIERVVALKTIHNSLIEGTRVQEFLARFKREAQAAGRLSHPNVVTIYEYGVDRGTPFIAMEFIDGRGLNEYLEEGVRFKLDRVVAIMRQVLEALDYCHRHGVIHRDLKPANIVILADGGVKITDFGIARIEASTLTQTGAIIGTPSYMSPEQFLAQPVDARSDLFSAAAILYEMLTGERCFPGKAPVTIMHKVLNAAIDNPIALNLTLPRSFDVLVQKALAKRPAERYQSAKEFEQALVLAAEDKLISVQPSWAAEHMPAREGGELVVAEPDQTLEARAGEFFIRKDRADGQQSGERPGAGARVLLPIVFASVLLIAGAVLWVIVRDDSKPVPKTASIVQPKSDKRADSTGAPDRVRAQPGRQPRIGDSPASDVFISTEYVKGAYYGMVNAASEPAGAGIYLDGESFGQTPLDFQLPPGSYQLVMKKGGYKDKATRLEVEPGVKISLNAILRRQ